MNTESPVFPTQVNLKPHARFKTYHFRKREKNLTTINVWLTFIDDSKLFLCHFHFTQFINLWHLYRNSYLYTTFFYNLKMVINDLELICLREFHWKALSIKYMLW